MKDDRNLGFRRVGTVVFTLKVAFIWGWGPIRTHNRVRLLFAGVVAYLSTLLGDNLGIKPGKVTHLVR